MRRSLQWALGGTVLACVAALWGTQSPGLISAVEPRIREHAEALDAVQPRIADNTSVVAPLPAELPRLQLDAAKRDPFVATEPPAPVPAPLPKVRPFVGPPAPPPPPPAPVVNYRFLGSMLTPSGERVVYLARGDAAIRVAAGDHLDEGYVVESVTSSAVQLVYPPLGAHMTVPIPQASPTP
jgi:hypothetical protein